MRKVICLMIALASVCRAGLEGNLLLSLGEAPYRPMNDAGGSIILPQAGIGLEYRGSYAAPFNDFTLGWYNGGLFIEDFAGVNIGYAFGWLKPALTLGLGIQNLAEKEFYLFDSDEYRLIRRTFKPFGVGIRADILERGSAAFEQRCQGYPWWRIRIGYRIF